MSYRKLFVPVLGLALAGMAGATTTFYTSQSLFNAATTGMTFQTISDLTASLTSNSAPLTDPSTGVMFTDQSDATSANLSVIDPSTLKLTSGFSMNLDVPATYTAYWFDIETVNGGGTVTVSSSSPSSNTPFTTPSPAGTLTFFGIVTDTAVSGLQLAGSGGIEITNFNVAGAAAESASPEGSTLMMIGGGLIALRALCARRSQAPA
jgi:hypothetical protein